MREFDDAALGAALRAIEAPGSQPDIGALVTAGRRRDRRRRAAAASGVFAAVAAITVLATLVVVTRRAAPEPVTPPPLTTCVAVPVKPPDTGAYIGSADPTGQYVDGAIVHTDTPGRYGEDPVVWHNGVAHPVSVANPPGSVNHLRGVNTSGWVVGDAFTVVDGVRHDQPMLYRDGRLTLLPLPPGMEDGSADSINSGGDIIGGAKRNGISVALLWPAAQPGTVVTLVTPTPSEDAVATTITDDGLVGGFLNNGAQSVPYLWTSPSTGHTLPLAGGMSSGEIWKIRGNYAVGLVTVTVSNAPGGRGSFTAEWDLATGKVRAVGTRAGAVPSGMDTAGAYVVNMGPPGRHGSYLVQPGRPDIPIPVPSGSPERFPYIVGMSADGHRLTGQLTNDKNIPVSGPMTWTCS